MSAKSWDNDKGSDRGEMPVSLRRVLVWCAGRLYRAGLSVWLPIILVTVSIAVLLTYRWSLDNGFADVRARGERRLDLYTASLEREIARYANVPSILGLDRDVIGLLSARQADPVAARRINLFLERLNSRAATTTIYIMDVTGHVVAASNWQRPDSFVGQNFSYRPYFSEAIQGRPGRFYGIGTTSGEPGYYLSHGILSEERWLGVAAVKVNLERLEQSWHGSDAPVFITDENGVIILSSLAAWRFSRTQPLSPAAAAELAKTRRYNRQALPALDMIEVERFADGARRVRFRHPHAQSGTSGQLGEDEYIIQSRPVENGGWSLTVLSGTAQAREIAFSHAALAGGMSAFLLFLLIMFNERRRHIRERLAAREALQRAHDELERKVEERTGELSETVGRLQQEVEERARAEQTLREAQAGLVQAGKLAVIGQLAAGITHELNQPLAALRTLASNTRKFLARDNLPMVESNLQAMGDLAERMGFITGQLKNFARKSTGQQQAVSLTKALASALFLLDARVRRGAVELQVDVPEDLQARCDQNRLEQVLVNLIGNALDAMKDSYLRLLVIRGEARDGRVFLTVRDTGCGLPPHIQTHLFEPFFTTKAAGEGLGLGLAISAGIIRDFGGNLSGANHPDGGAVFTLELPLAPTEATP